MKCQSCNEAATHHVTEIVGGEAVEHHVCDAHLRELEALGPATPPPRPAQGFGAFPGDDPEARRELAAHLLPALCLALLAPRPEVRALAALYLLHLGPDARSAAGALRGALQDADERVRKAAELALQHIEAD